MAENNPSYFPTLVELSDGTTILMEVAQDPTYDGPVSVQELQISAKLALRGVASLAADIKEAIKSARPDKVTAEFAVELEKKGDDVFSKICNVSGKGSIKFTLEWNFGDKGKSV